MVLFYCSKCSAIGKKNNQGTLWMIHLFVGSGFFQLFPWPHVKIQEIDWMVIISLSCNLNVYPPFPVFWYLNNIFPGTELNILIMLSVWANLHLYCWVLSVWNRENVCLRNIGDFTCLFATYCPNTCMCLNLQMLLPLFW